MTQQLQFLSNVEQIMATRVQVVAVDQPISDVRDLFDINGGQPVPVVDVDNRFIGVITSEHLFTSPAKTAGEAAIRTRMTVAPHESAFSVIKRMLTRKVDWVPVLRGDKLVGTISRDCVLSAFGETKVG